MRKQIKRLVQAANRWSDAVRSERSIPASTSEGWVSDTLEQAERELASALTAFAVNADQNVSKAELRAMGANQ